MYFFYDFRSIEGCKECGLKPSKSDFDQTKIDDEKYIKKFLKKHTNTFLPSCKINSCYKYCEWYVKIVIDFSCAKLKDLVGKELDILTLNYLVHNIDENKYENLFNFDGRTMLDLKEKYYKLGHLSYNNNKTKIVFDKLPENDNNPYMVKVTQIITE